MEVGRLDLLATEGSEGFYRALRHQAMIGFRIYPNKERSP
ncbi:MAG: GNAT family acetyltransferase [Chloroflexota bacterium]|nr:GNAT family acetyltransferase [Chloroflexota bacterium]